MAVLDGRSARQEEHGEEVVREDDAGERGGDLGESLLFTGEEVEEEEPRGVLGGRGGGSDEEAVGVEEGVAGRGQVMAPGKAEAVDAAETGVEDRLGEGREKGDEEEWGLRGEEVTGRREKGAVGGARGAEGEEVL